MHLLTSLLAQIWFTFQLFPSKEANGLNSILESNNYVLSQTTYMVLLMSLLQL